MTYALVDQQIGLMLTRDLQFAYQNFGKQILGFCDQNPRLADIPIQVIYLFLFYFNI